MGEQEVIDMTNTIARNGLVYFPEFCAVVLKKFREEDEEQFSQIMFKMLCGTEPFPELYRAKKYKIQQKYLTKAEFQFIMRSLPVKVAELEIEEMFKVADVDNDGKIGYKDFQKNSDNVLKNLTSLQTACHGQENPPRLEPEEVFPSFDKDSCSVDVNASFSSDPLLSANLSA